MIFPKSSYFVAAFLASRLDYRGVNAHGYLKTPRSRNYFASVDPIWWGGEVDDPAPENCPHCLNIGGTEAQCGKVGDHNYDYPPNAIGEGTLAPIIQECYEEGAVIDVESVLTAHHKGHFELKACPIAPGEVPTQSCFDNNKLTFVEDKLYGAPADPLYPERAYIPLAENTLKEANGNYKYHHRYQLPEGLQGDLILIQWYYVTANSCALEGYDTYDFPPGFDPGTSTCTSVAPDGRGLPEQFWNCAEVEIRVTGDCGTDQPPSPPTTALPTKAPTPLPSKAPTPANIDEPPTPPTPTPPTPGFNYSADHGEDSRLIAYVGNWQDCPTDAQVDAYSHMVIAFAVSYTWSPGQNICDNQCNLASTVPICGNQNRQDLVDSWRAKGKKVILSFGGAGMGGSWPGDTNNCWDYCFGKEDQLSTDLTSIIATQNFDGIDIDYEYCYDVAGKQSGNCPQRTSLYSDEKAQTFLDTLTSNLRVKLDALQVSNEYNRGRYEITHAPMDSDLVPSNGFASQYFRILKDRRADLDFLMPQFYNGVTRPGLDGVDGTGAGAMSAAVMFSSLANDLFDQEPHKVVFGFCISDCSGTGSNISSDAAVEVMSDLKTYNNDEFMCNGGAFFWVASHDSNGLWSDNMVQEVSLTAGCSVGGTPPPSASPTEGSPYPTYSPTSSDAPTGEISSPTFSPSQSPSISSPTKSPSTFPTKSPITLNPNCAAHSNSCSATNPCPNGGCCSQWGYCGTSAPYCGDCCQSGHCWASPPTSPASQPTTAPSKFPTVPLTTTTSTVTSTTTNTPNPNCHAHSNQCSATNPCDNGLCCSQWGYCGSSAGYCEDCCQSGNCWA